MKPSSYRRLPALTFLLGSLALIGCGGAMTLPDSVVGSQAKGPALQGKVFGGHSPIVGMHVYLAQPGTGGYGSPAISILTTGTANVSVADGGDPYVPVGAMYATSDPVTGNFTFGPYTCTAGQPVFVYGYGGTPLATAPTGYTIGTPITTTTTTPTPETVSITGITVAGSNAGTNNDGAQGNATYTITVGSALPLTADQTVFIAGLTGNLSILNGNQTATAATTGANTTFKITATAVYGSYTYSYYTERKNKNGGGYTYSDQVTGTYYETVGNGAYTGTTGEAGDDGGGNDNGPDPDYEFTVTGGTTGSPSTGTRAFGAGTATATEPVTTTTTNTTYAPTTNPIVQLASLGNCDSAAFDALSYIYMNEVSTIAAAYTFQPFTLPTNNNAWDIGSSGTTQALKGIANAAETAAQLYAVQGNTQISTTDVGEGHLANFETQEGGSGGTANAGNGVVPQATIDALADILASCIDSAVGTENSISTQCTTLFNTATDGGGTVASGDTAATDTAAAAIDIARYPAGNNSLASGDVDTNYVSDLFGTLSGTLPYSPALANAPNDWTIAINYPLNGVSGAEGATNPSFGSAESIAVDNVGNIWVTAQAKDYVGRFSPLGVSNNEATYGSYIYGYVSIDGQNNAWAGNADSTSGIEEFNTNGVLTNTYGSGYNSAYTVIANQAGDISFVANTAATDVTTGIFIGGNCVLDCNTTKDYELFEYGPGGAAITGSPFSISPSSINAGDDVSHGSIDQLGNLWLTSEGSDQIANVSPTGAAQFNSFGTGSAALQPEFPAIDHTNSAWIPLQDTAGEIDVVTPAANPGANATPAVKTLTSANTGATFNIPFGAAIDGNGNVWITNRCDYHSSSASCTNTSAANNTLVVLNGTGTNGVVDQAISPATNYIPEAQYPSSATTFTPMLDDSLNLAIDPSGNIWITNYLGNSVVEVVGAAAPVVTPLSVAAGTSMLGAKP